MKLRYRSKLVIAAALGLAFSAIAAHAQLVLNVNSRTTFHATVGGNPNNVTNNGGSNVQEVVTSGTPISDPFTITFTPFVGPATVTLGTGTLDTMSLVFHSGLTPLNYFTSIQMTRDIDFDNDGIYDVSQNYTINLASFTASNGFTGVNYSIVPQLVVGNVMINGTQYAYSSVIANDSGILFDGSTTTAINQFQFNVTPVPEPSTYALAGVMALGGIVALRRRRTAGLAALAA